MKIRFGLVLMLALGLGTAGCAAGGASGGSSAGSAPSVPGGEALLQGERPRQTENTRAAQRHLDAGDEADDPAEARMHYEQAMTAAEAAIAEDGRNPLAHRQAALSALALEDYATAGAHFDHAMELRPIYEFEDTPIREGAWIELYQQAIPMVNGGDYEGATPIFENANAIYSKRPEAMITLGQLYAQLRQHDDALRNIDMALEVIDSDIVEEMDSATVASWEQQTAELPMLRATVLADAGRFEEAAVAFRTLWAQNPDDLLAGRNLAGILVQMDDTEGAFAVYEQLMANPNLSAADFYTMGVGYYTGSDYSRAAEAFNGALERNPRDRDALEMLVRSLDLGEAYTDVPAAAQRWIDLDPNGQNAYLILAKAVNANGDEDAARAAIETVDGLQVSVNDLQIVRLGDGGARVQGSVVNKQLAQGASVTLEFTFYSASGSAMGTVSEVVSLSAPGMASVFQAEFSSMEQVGGYGYTLTGG